MDPTMGETNVALLPAVTGQAAFGSEEPAVTAAVVEAAPAPEAPATNYPAGVVNFNLPFEVASAYDDDIVHADAHVLTILKGNNYPVVVISTNEVGDQVVSQFDTDGDSVDGDLKAENKFFGERAMFVVILKDGRSFQPHDVLFDSEAAAISAMDDNDDFYAVLPVTIPATKQEIETDSAEDTSTEPQPEGTVTVNGIAIKPGDKVRTFRRGFGERTCTVIKTRGDAWKSAYIQADSDGTGPYWALNKNIRYRVS